MFCINCGAENRDRAKFCQKCGKELLKRTLVKKVIDEVEVVDQKIAPYPYVISTTKLIVLSIATFGLYEIYWFYRQCKSTNFLLGIKRGKFTLLLDALFAGFTAFPLFKHISTIVSENDKENKIRPDLLATLFLIFNICIKASGFFILGQVVILVFVQKALNKYWEKRFDDKLVKSKFGTGDIVLTVIGAMLYALAFYGSVGNTNGESFKDLYRQNFVKACIEGDSTKVSYCTCVANYMTSNYSETELTRFDTEYESSGSLPKEIMAASTACISLLNQ